MHTAAACTRSPTTVAMPASRSFRLRAGPPASAIVHPVSPVTCPQRSRRRSSISLAHPLTCPALRVKLGHCDRQQGGHQVRVQHWRPIVVSFNVFCRSEVAGCRRAAFLACPPWWTSLHLRHAVPAALIITGKTLCGRMLPYHSGQQRSFINKNTLTMTNLA